MNGGRLSRVTRRPLRNPAATAERRCRSGWRGTPGTPWSAARVAMTIIARMRDGADRQVDAGGEDDQGLADRQGTRPPRPAGTAATGAFGEANRGLRIEKTTKVTDEQERAGSATGGRAAGAGPAATGLCRRRANSAAAADVDRRHREVSPSRSSRPASEVMLSTPSAGLSVTSATPVLKKSRPVGGRRLLAAAGDLGDRLHAEGRHLQRVLLRGGADDAVGLTALTPGAATVDRDDERVGVAGSLQGRRGADRGRLVDRVDHVDVGFLVRQVSMAVRPPSSAPLLGSLQTIV